MVTNFSIQQVRRICYCIIHGRNWMTKRWNTVVILWNIYFIDKITKIEQSNSFLNVANVGIKAAVSFQFWICCYALLLLHPNQVSQNPVGPTPLGVGTQHFLLSMSCAGFQKYGLGSGFFLQKWGSWERKFGNFVSWELKFWPKTRLKMQLFYKSWKWGVGARELHIDGKLVG